MTKKYPEHRGNQIYVIGIAVGEFEFQGRFYARFVKSYIILDRFQKMMKKLEGTVSANRIDNYIDSRSSNNNTGNIIK